SVLGGSRQWFPLNQQAQLICAATGQSIVDRIEWTRVDGHLPNDVEDHNEEGLLIFGNFQSSNAGEYECRGYRKDNLIGTSNVTVYVDDGSFSDVARVEISPPGVRIINEGDSIILDCNVRAVRPTSMHWKFYARPLRRSHQKKPKITINTGRKHRRPIILEDLDGSGKFLHLREVKPYDAGLYAVIANMSDGTSMISRQSWVVVKPRGHDGEVKYKWSLAHGGTLIPEVSKEQRLT
uniref:Ig-like domain-containing protein n=1 Tax=Panagrolaimus sp. JU765 TaxID=591449 RepID=A0AC34RKX2_9BILA